MYHKRKKDTNRKLQSRSFVLIDQPINKIVLGVVDRKVREGKIKNVISTFCFMKIKNFKETKIFSKNL